MHICFITNKYPIVEPNVIVFLQQLVSAIAEEELNAQSFVLCK